ncbi:FliA/WhiG family RNA polymerase sigma factor [Priestia aryabhattai]|uniref:FliA/WhiG family RNA polymerase sigma factor n=1 Tax=Bacillaceae TaxID=186817 RepID=UPI000BA00B2D|nr:MULTISPECIES: FliA/WhiG family RNA polymerase sigma factor [Bacillaceae]MDT2045816.1 FliA/WhiG family RNA polymerase sigma factor [Priestia flexa]OZT11601.1 FliA/WhiG family RNA polymerase sigma factor [Priestia aryabhattai]TDB50450.1 FliA/WhiG family RNA polymerase sigma factor [Bacillus sp. CBEL-1]USY54146.1 FliA/WhiG family RNA polymerase sigma factor [Bacillus sp. 1780r2a1]
MTSVNVMDEKKRWEKWSKQRDEEAGNLLVKQYMPLVNYHVQRIGVGLPRNVHKEELKSLGLIGLYDALEKFDHERDLKFDTYASFRIRGAILDGLRKEDWLSRSAREKAKRVEHTIEKLEQRYLRNVTVQEIASEIKMTEEEVVHVMNEGFFANVLSIEEPIKEHDEGDHQSYAIRDERMITPEDHLLKEEYFAELVQIIEQLNEKEQLVISLFYKEELTFTEIGHILGLSTSRISQIHSKALFKLRNTLNKMM